MSIVVYVLIVTNYSSVEVIILWLHNILLVEYSENMMKHNFFMIMNETFQLKTMSSGHDSDRKDHQLSATCLFLNCPRGSIRVEQKKVEHH